MPKRREKLPPVRILFRRNFLAGLLVLIPLAFIVWIVRAFLRWIWALYSLVPSQIRPEGEAALWINLIAAAAVLVALAFGISLLGWASKFYLGEQLLAFIHRLIQRIPILGTIYSSLDQLLRTFAYGGGQQFSRVVYVEYPRKGTWAVAFVTGPVKSKNAPPRHLNVFIPTVPNPTSGFHLIVPEEEVRDSGLRVEEAFRYILSLGIVQRD